MMDGSAEGLRSGDGSAQAPAPTSDWALFLDLDGTLLDIAATPDTVEIPQALQRDLLRASARLDGALAIVTGRRIAGVDALLGGAMLTVAGQHGGELRRAGETSIRRATARAALGRAARDHIARAASQWPGVIVEKKELGLAVHYRLAPWARDPLGRTLGDVAAVSGGALRLLDGDRVWEITPAAFDKGTALETLMSSRPFAGRIPVFVGDDVTDEDGFAAALRLGGLALRVGDRRAATSAAPRIFADAAAVRRWLAAFARAAAG